MGRPSDALNEKQLAVLRWVADGADPSQFPPGDFAHRISANALAGRGLISTTGHGPSWRAVMTPAGMSRLAALDEVKLPDEKLSASAQLFKRVEEAGGILCVDEGEDAVDYRALVDASLRSPSRPLGRRLAIKTIGNAWTSRVREISFEVHHFDLVAPVGVAVPSRLSSPHEATRSFLDDENFKYVSKRSVQAAARIYEALARASEAKGWQPAGRRKSHSATANTRSSAVGHLFVTASETPFCIGVREIAGTGSVKIGWPEKHKLPRWEQNRGYAFTPTGRFEVRIDGPGMPYQGRKFRETRRQTVEDILPLVLRHIEAAGREQSDARDRRAADLEIRRSRWETAMAEARELYKADAIRQQIEVYAERWKSAEKVGQLVEAIQVAMPSLSGQQKADAELWIDWANRLSTPEALIRDLPPLTYKEPADSELKPFLRGWSTTPPTL